LQVGLPADTALRVAVAMATDARVNPHGVGGFAAIVANPEDTESKIGFGQHGGLGVNEQNPFLIAEGGGFAARSETRPTSLIDIAPTVLRHLHMDHDDMDGRALPLDT
ncbi:MAG: nucleotide pyrophosphatase, partial [Stellaceae bacterium]